MKQTMPHIALVSAPWPLFNRPSIQLGALKAFLQKELPHAKINAHHAYLLVAAELGYHLYRPISRRTWLAEVPYAALLYSEKQEDLERLWRWHQRGIPPDEKQALDTVCRKVQAATKRFLDSVSWKQTRLAGLSICLAQLTSSIYLAQEIRRRAPSTTIVAGGSACAGRMGRSLLDTFADIDYVISGEGETVLLHLARSLLSPGFDSVPAHPGLISRLGPQDDEAVCQVDSLDPLPVPDFQEYFSLLDSLPPEARFIPGLPVEISRGCWWRSRGKGTEDRGCRFCNLNLQWRGYRAKAPSRASQEVDLLSRKHRSLSLSLTDNLLPARTAKGLFTELARLPREFHLFAETRATTSPETLEAMAAGGIQDIQVGIEALSTSLLRKIGKGTTTLQNLEVMKRCEAPGMPILSANLILQFPGSDENDVAETLRTLEWALPFRPLKAIPFQLGYGSPIWNSPKAYGIHRTFNHPHYARLFPDSVLKSLVLMNQGYHGGVRFQQRIWKPVRKRVRDWQRGYEALHENPGSEPILTFRDGTDFMIIRQRRLGESAMTHRIEGRSREIYLFCDRPRSLTRILARFPRLGEDRVRPFLRMMVSMRLMYEEGDKYLSLAVPVNSRPYKPGKGVLEAATRH